MWFNSTTPLILSICNFKFKLHLNLLYLNYSVIPKPYPQTL